MFRIDLDSLGELAELRIIVSCGLSSGRMAAAHVRAGAAAWQSEEGSTGAADDSWRRRGRIDGGSHSTVADERPRNLCSHFVQSTNSQPIGPRPTHRLEGPGRSGEAVPICRVSLGSWERPAIMTTACDKVTGPADGGLGQHASYVTQNLSKRPTLFDMRPGLRIIGALVSFESVFILFLICGSYKTDPRFSSLPIDLNVLFFAAGIAMGLVIIYREGIYLPGLTVVALLIVFIAWALLTSLWTPSELYAHEKLLKLTTLNLWSVMASAMIIANRPQRVRRFLLLLLVFGTAAAIDGIMQYGGGRARSLAPPAFACTTMARRDVCMAWRALWLSPRGCTPIRSARSAWL
jgi:hypothetical protein